MKPFADRVTDAGDISTATEMANDMFVNDRSMKV